MSKVYRPVGTKTELNYEKTRHRYPWVCSLRTKGITAEHLGTEDLVNTSALEINPVCLPYREVANLFTIFKSLGLASLLFELVVPLLVNSGTVALQAQN